MNDFVFQKIIIYKGHNKIRFFGGFMYLYMITNLVNNKRYIGITNDYKKRWVNHKCCNDTSMAIARAIKKYGVENFKFEVLLSGIPIDKIDEYEMEYIKKYNTLITNGHGYNISTGGRYFQGVTKNQRGANNGNAHLTEEEVRYIKSHRNQPEYVLYDLFSEKLSYGAFKNIYTDKTYKDIRPTVPMYPYNIEFSGQFTGNNKLDYGEVVELRKKYAAHIPWRVAYQDYQDIYPDQWTFWAIYNGDTYRLVMPEVFTEENKKAHTAIRAPKGERNRHAKLTWDNVRQIRYDYEHHILTRKELQKRYSQVSSATINAILRYQTWKE